MICLPISRDNSFNYLFQCLNKFSLQQMKINECINGPKGLEDLSDMGNITAKLDPKLKNVPSVAVNKVIKICMNFS